MTKRFSADWFSILLILVIPIIALWQVSFFAYTMKWDMMDQFFPCRYFMSECFKEHSLPLWCPYINFGYPAYADMQAGFFYPVTWLISITAGYTVYSIAAEYIFHLLIACIGFYLLLRACDLSKNTAVVFGILYCLSGIFISNASHLSWVISLAWMPMILFCFKRVLDKPNWLTALGLSFFTALSLTGGYPGFFIILSYFLIIYSVYTLATLLVSKDFAKAKAVFLFLTLSACVLLVLSAGFLYSLWQTIPLIERGEGLSVKGANSIPFSPAAMISFLFPFVTGSKSYITGTDLTMTNAYCGLFILPMLIFALFKAQFQNFQKAFLLFGLICLGASMGEYCFVRSWLYYLPGMNFFRHAAIFRGFTVLGLLLFAASGFDWFLNIIKQQQANRFAKNVLFLFTLLLVMVFIAADIYNVGFIAFPKNLSPGQINWFNENQSAATHLLAQCAVQIILLSLFVIVFLFVKKPRLKTNFILALVIADILLAVQLNLPATVISETKPVDLNEAIKNVHEDFIAESKKPIESFSHMGNGNLQPIWFNNSFFKKVPAFDGFNNFQLKGQWTLEASPGFRQLIKHPLCFFTSTSSEQEDSSTNYAITKFSPQEIKIQYSSDGPRQLILLQSNFPGWTATCEGRQLPIVNFEKIFMQCATPSGNHIISFSFQPFLPKFFFWYTVACFAGIVALMALIAYRNTGRC